MFWNNKIDESKRYNVEEPVIDMFKPKEEYIWVDGFKGTFKNMTCMPAAGHTFQFEIGKEYEIEGEPIPCKHGFHLCLTLNDVFSYYRPFFGNQFFKVKAYVRKKDFEQYGKYNSDYYIVNKLCAKKIIFTEEVAPEVLFEAMKQRRPDFNLDFELESVEEMMSLKSEEEYRSYIRSKHAKCLSGLYSDELIENIKESNNFKNISRLALILYKEGVSQERRIEIILKNLEYVL